MSVLLPPELLLVIFSMTTPDRGPRNFGSNSFLPTLALLNKFFLSVARRELYSEVFLTDTSRAPVRDVTYNFLRTIKVSPALADNVHAIHYGGGEEVSEDEIRYLADIISRTDNLLHLRIFGFEYYSLHRLVTAIRSRKRLQSIEVSTFTLANQYSSIFCGLVPFFQMLQGWPDIRAVTMHSQTIGWERNASFSLADVLPGSCAHLARFVYRCAEYWEDRHLRSFARMAPNVREVVLFGVLTEMTKAGIGDALETWRRTLTSLSIHFPNSEYEGESYNVLGVDAYITPLAQLRVLEISSSYILPRSFERGPTGLKKLTYWVRKEQFEEFVMVLGGGSALPQLKELDVWLLGHDGVGTLDAEVLDRLVDVCRARGIALKTSSRSYPSEGDD